LVATAINAVPVSAQGRGNAFGKVKAQGGPATTSSAAPTGALTGGAVAPGGAASRQFGSWLDDASLIDPGNAWTSISFGHYNVASGHQTTFPSIDASVGVARNIQVGGSLPYYRMSFTDGSALHGLGDLTLNAKFGVAAPSSSTHNLGMSLSTVLEILETAPPDGSRYAFAVPVNVEWHPERVRVYGSTGFFTRGAVFAAGALEIPINERLVATGALTHMRSIKDNAAADLIKLPNARTDVTGTGSFFVTPTFAVYGGLGRTVSELNVTGTSLMITAGVSATFAAPARP
jgi:hypothetical protein